MPLARRSRCSAVISDPRKAARCRRRPMASEGNATRRYAPRPWPVLTPSIWLRSPGGSAAHGRWWCSPGPGSRPSRGSPTSGAPRACGRRTPRPRSSRNLHYYMTDPEVRVASWQARLVHPAWTAEPNAGHRALAELERQGHLDTLVTQNIDGLHQKAGSSPELVIEIHGTVREVDVHGLRRAGADGAGARPGARPGRPTRPAGPAAASSSRPRSPSARTWSPTTSMRAEKAAAELRPVPGPRNDRSRVYPVAALPEMALRGGRPPRDRQRRADAVRPAGRRRAAGQPRRGPPPARRPGLTGRECPGRPARCA